MAETTSFPQIPATVWWGVRDILKKTTRAILNESFLAVQLGVQPAAARQYTSELRRVGLINEDGKPTDLALKWRLDDEYAAAVEKILASAYNEELLNLAPTVDDKEKAVSWFEYQGLGSGAARNKAATYFLIGSPEPGQSASKTNGATPTPRATKKKPKQTETVQVDKTSPDRSADTRTGSSVFPVNLNLQIHISSEASAEQIDAIFSSMRKHLGNAKLS
tara:strand:- start:668 stop:1327 length:660 start_codon:yes stop_codon:yes gene_type:complete